MNDSAPPSNETEIRFSVLLVDDEPLILSSLRRLLRNQPYDLLLAESGEQALQLLESRPVDLVVSDARMPNMDGAALLAEIHRRFPETIRILLTGHADLPTIAKAINEGRIHHYLSKPWNDDELLLTLRQSLEYLYSERERRRLERLTQEQNDRLQQLNATLEKRVQARTAELQQTADMLDLAYEEPKRSYVVGTEVFAAGQPAPARTSRPTSRSSNWSAPAVPAVSSTNRMVATWRWPRRSQHRQAELERHPAPLALGPALSPRPRSFPRLPGTQRVAADVAGADAGRRPPDSPSPGALGRQRLSGPPQGRVHPLGSRLLKLAVDFVELQRGLILERRMNRDEALIYIRKYAGRLYDPELIEPFIQVCATTLADVTLADPQVRAHGTRDLVPGMVLARNLTANNGMLLLNAGKVLNLALIEKLIAFEAIEGARYTLFVRLPESTT